jgi:hypothetical protein
VEEEVAKNALELLKSKPQSLEFSSFKDSEVHQQQT